MEENNKEKEKDNKEDEKVVRIKDEFRERVKILVVDDSDFSRKSIVDIVDKNGFTVAGQAEDAEKAVALMHSQDINLFIIDVVMPGINGIELAKQIHENFSSCYILMISSLGQENIIIESIGAGAIDFLRKPFSEIDLIDSLERIMMQMQEEGQLQG